MGIKFNLNNLNKVNEAIAESFEATVDAYAEQCQIELQSEKWDWPRMTHRQNGEVVGSPRSAVDTGDLINSQQVEIEGNTALVSYASEHALDVYAGKVENGVLKPSRPWLDTALEEIDLEAVFAEEMRDRL
jgi:hypothetical protein